MIVYPVKAYVFITHYGIYNEWIGVIIIVSAKFSGIGDVEVVNDYKVRSKKM
jgi:hypothetical protein